MMNENREQWSSKIEFLLSCIGFAVGYGNFWRFPFKCFKNGGGAFLLPFVITLLVAGIPLFMLELAIGQHTQLGPLRAWKKISPFFSGIGYGMVVVCVLVSIYYNVILAWSIFYFFNTFQSRILPWTRCDPPDACCDPLELAGNETCVRPSPSKHFFVEQVLALGKGIDSFEMMNWNTAGCLLLAWIMVYFCIWKGIKTTGKVVYVTAVVPYVMLLIFLAKGLSLPGSHEGVMYLITPKWEYLCRAEVWVEAASQVFYSLTLGFGVILSFASYNKKSNNFFRDAFVISITDALTSILSGFVVFAYLGYMAHIQNKDISDPTIATDGPGLVFVVYPAALASLPQPTLWSAIFFLMLVTLGLDSQFGQVELICLTIMEAFPHRFRREVVGLVVCIILFFLGLPCMSSSGIYWFNLLDSCSAGISILFLGICELIAVSYFFGAERFKAKMEEMLSFSLSVAWINMWKFITPTIITLICFFGLARSKRLTYEQSYIYPAWANVFGWLVTLTSILCVPIVAAIVKWRSYKQMEEASVERIVMRNINNDANVYQL